MTEDLGASEEAIKEVERAIKEIQPATSEEIMEETGYSDTTIYAIFDELEGTGRIRSTQQDKLGGPGVRKKYFVEESLEEEIPVWY